MAFIDEKMKTLLMRVNSINLRIIENLDLQNVDQIFNIVKSFEKQLQIVFNSPSVKKQINNEALIWKSFSKMSEEEIRKELMDESKYPDINSIKEAVKGYLDMQKVSKVKTRETLIKHIIETFNRGKFISDIGK